MYDWLEWGHRAYKRVKFILRSCFYIEKTEIWAQVLVLAMMLANIKMIKAERSSSRKKWLGKCDCSVCCWQSNQEFADCFAWGQLQAQEEAVNIWCKEKGQDLTVQPWRSWSLGHFFGQRKKIVGQGLDTMDTFPSSYCCLCTLLHPGSSSSSNLGSFRLSTELRQDLCVSSTLGLAWHQFSSIKRSKMQFLHLAKEHGDGSKYSYKGKKCEWVAVFLEE